MISIRKQFAKNHGFSIIEVILYVLLLSIIVTSMMTFVVQILERRGDAEFDREVIENARYILDKMTHETRHSEGVTSGTGSYGVNPSSLRLNQAGTGYVIFNTNTKTVTLGGSGYTVTYIQLEKDGEAPVQVTSDNVNVSNFTVYNRTRGTEPEILQFDITLESINQDSSMNFKSAATSRI